MTNIDLVAQWFNFAGTDLRTAKHIYETQYPKPLNIICYLCQQAAEKALKGYLVYKEVDPPHIHDLAVLCNICSEADASFKAIEQPCMDVTPYGVAARYPDEIAVDELITQAAIARTQIIYDFALSKVPPLHL